MNAYYLDKEAYEYLMYWADQNKTAVIWSPYFFKKCRVILKDSEFIKFFVEAKKDCYKFNLVDDVVVLNGKIVQDESGENDFKLEYSARDKFYENAEQYIMALKLFGTAFIHCNAFMWYGNLIDNKEFIASGKNEGNDKIITFRKYRDTIYAVPVGSHKSPEGVFSVRGHFRRYKNGKVIWIDEYLKGTGN